MQNKKILVTGANGYLGRHVVNTLLDMGCEVLAADLRFEGMDPRAIQVSEPIFSEDPDLYKKLGEPDACIHLAWRDGFQHASVAHMQDLSKHFMFVKTMVEGGLKQIAVMGSMHEIGYWGGEVNEDTPTNPSTLYGIAKDTLRKSVFLLKNEYPELMVQWVRGYYIMGDDQMNHSIFTKILEADKEGKPEFPFTSGKNKYDFINVDELAAQISAATIQTEVQGIINCCTGNPVSLADKVEEFIKEKNYKIRPEYGAFPDRPYDSPGVWGDPEKINQIMKNC